MKTARFFGSVTGLVLVVVSLGVFGGTGDSGDVGMVTIESVAEPILTPRVRVTNTLNESVSVWFS